ncbi:hypothetical protein DPMN_094093 [Dreissena polymorpha]|uniref:Uncharacterized protein n=1 Tax=Dreissena polymorpha TaxID=45954 RepID=A0A9D4R1I8_DREPO|nr:hypothetical protein DPMN_094093 [Dreissena polymorpha]
MKQTRTARVNREKIQIRYSAKLCINERPVSDMFPEWFDVLRESRTMGFQKYTTTSTKSYPLPQNYQTKPSTITTNIHNQSANREQNTQITPISENTNEVNDVFQSETAMCHAPSTDKPPNRKQSYVATEPPLMEQTPGTPYQRHQETQNRIRSASRGRTTTKSNNVNALSNVLNNTMKNKVHKDRRRHVQHKNIAPIL